MPMVLRWKSGDTLPIPMCVCVIDLSVSWIYSFRFLDARLAREDSVNDWGELTSPCGADLGGAARPSALIRNSQQPVHPRLRHLRLVFRLLRRHPRPRTQGFLSQRSPSIFDQALFYLIPSSLSTSSPSYHGNRMKSSESSCILPIHLV